jgi:hypothetical protein
VEDYAFSPLYNFGNYSRAMTTTEP